MRASKAEHCCSVCGVTVLQLNKSCLMGTHDRHGMLFGKNPRMYPRHLKTEGALTPNNAFLLSSLGWKSFMKQEKGCDPDILTESLWGCFVVMVVTTIFFFFFQSCAVIKSGFGNEALVDSQRAEEKDFGANGWI